MNQHPSSHRPNVTVLPKRHLAWIALTAYVFLLMTTSAQASPRGPALVVNTEAFKIIDDSDTASNVVLKFGDALNKTLTYNRAAGRFEFNDDLEVKGSLSGATLTISDLKNCNTVDTDGNGNFVCGMDEGGEGGGLTYPNAAGIFVKKSGDTMTGALIINLTSGFMGLKVMQMLSGSVIHAEKTLTSSGTILSTGNLTTRGTASGKNLTFMGATSSYILGSLGIGTATPETKLEVVGTISGSSLKASGNLSVSGSILTELNTGGGIVYSNTGTLATTAKGSSGQVLVAQGTAAPAFKNPTGSMVWYLDGITAVGARQGATVTMPFAMTATSVNLRAGGAPTGTALIVDINEGGTTLFGTRPQINAGATTGGGGASFSDTAIAAGAELSIDIDQVGSTFAGSGITIQLNGVRKY